MGMEQTGSSLTFLALFTASKVGKTGLTPTVNVWRIQTDGTTTQIVTSGSATAVAKGIYRYVLSGASVTLEGEYLAVFETTDSSVDQQEVPSLWSVSRAGVENLDATVGSRLASASYSSPPSVSAIRTELDTNSTKLAQLDASISSRSTFAGGAVQSVTNPVSLSSTAVDAVLDEVLEGTFTMRQVLRLLSSMLLGLASGGGTTSISFRDLGDTKNRIVMSVDSKGNRTSVALDPD